MKEKKRSANWYIAATHYLTAGFAIPLVVNLIGGLLFAAILPAGIIRMIGLMLLSLLGVWWGVKYSSGYLRKTYIVTDKTKIVNLTISYFIVIMLIYLGTQLSTGKLEGIDIIFEAGRIAAIGVVLYLASQKYVTEDSQATA